MLPAVARRDFADEPFAKRPADYLGNRSMIFRYHPRFPLPSGAEQNKPSIKAANLECLNIMVARDSHDLDAYPNSFRIPSSRGRIASNLALVLSTTSPANNTASSFCVIAKSTESLSAAAGRVPWDQAPKQKSRPARPNTLSQVNIANRENCSARPSEFGPT